MKKNPYIYILLAGILWSTQGILGKFLEGDLTSLQVAFSRVFAGFLFIAAFTFARYKSELRVDVSGMVKMAAIGMVCQAMNNICFFYCVSNTSVAAAVALLYTAPIFAVIMSRIVLGERITRLKSIALLVCSVSCFLTVTGGDIRAFSGSLLGIFAGMFSGFAYGINGIAGKLMMRRYNSYVVLFYSFGFGSLFMMPFCNPAGILPRLSTANVAAGIFMIGLLPSFLAFGCYFTGIFKGALPSKASMFATVELVVAVVLSHIFFKEPLELARFFGMAGIFLAMYILYRDSKASAVGTAQ